MQNIPVIKKKNQELQSKDTERSDSLKRVKIARSILGLNVSNVPGYVSVIMRKAETQPMSVLKTMLEDMELKVQVKLCLDKLLEKIEKKANEEEYIRRKVNEVLDSTIGMVERQWGTNLKRAKEKLKYIGRKGRPYLSWHERAQILHLFRTKSHRS